MQRRKLGKTGFEVAPLALGGNVFGWTVDEPTSFGLLDAFVEAGCNLIDTADSYSRWVPGHQGGESETIIGRWIARRGRHDDVVVATKVGSDMGLGHKCLRKEYILRAAEQSLRRLQVEAIDLYQSHWDDETTPFDETLEAYARLIEQGKVKAIGASNLSADATGAGARRQRATSPAALHDAAAAVQPVRSQRVRGPARGTVCPRRHRRDHLFFAGGRFPERQIPLRRRLREECTRAGDGQVPEPARTADTRGAGRRCGSARRNAGCRSSLAWLMARPGVTAPIASATSLAQLGELIAATRLVLDADSVRALDRASE